MKQEPTPISGQPTTELLESGRDMTPWQGPEFQRVANSCALVYLRASLTAAAAFVEPVATRAHSSAAQPADIPSFELDETTITDLQEAMKSGKYSARSLAEKYLARIDQIDKQGPAINAVIELNPDALAIADGLDKERKDKGVRGPLHGIPVLIKDNIDTGDKMMTTAGSLALLGSKPSKDSTVAQKLREAGAVILGENQS